MNNDGGTDADVKARIGKARVAFLQLKNIWSARPIATQTKIRIFDSNVKSVLLFGSETWRSTKKTTRKVQTFLDNSPSDAYSRYTGQKPSAMWNYGSVQSKGPLKWK